MKKHASKPIKAAKLLIFIDFHNGHVVSLSFMAHGFVR
jgi:hypothetical protein